MNTEKWRTGNLGLLSEADRSMYKNKDTVSKSIIHPELTHLNYNMCPHPQYTAYKVKEINRKIRGKEIPKNAIAWGSTVLTMPKDYTGSVEDFFKVGYEGMKEMYGLTDDDIISAYVHMDETTPHMHFYFIPIHHERNKEDCINWNKVMPRKMYKMQHEILQAYMSEKLQTDVHLLNGETLGIDLQRLSAEDKKLSMGLSKKQKELESTKEEIKLEEEHKEQLQNEVLDLQEEINGKDEILKLKDQAIVEKEKVAAEIYQPYIEAQERLLKQYEALTPKQQAKEQAILDLLKESKYTPFGDPERDRQKIREATAALKKESERLDERYFAEVEEPEGWEYD